MEANVGNLTTCSKKNEKLLHYRKTTEKLPDENRINTG